MRRAGWRRASGVQSRENKTRFTKISSGSAESFVAVPSSKQERAGGGHFVTGRSVYSWAILAFALLLAAAPARAQTPAPSGGSASSSSSSSGPVPAPVAAQGDYSGSVPSKLVPGVLQLSLQEAIDRGLKQNLGLLLSGQDVRTARGARWQQLSALLPNVTASSYVDASRVDLAEFGFSFN